MAKKAAADGPNKSKAIRDYLAANPEATAKTIVPALKAQGIDVKASYVAMIKSNSKKAKPSKAKKGKAPAKSAAAKPAAAPAAVAKKSTGLTADDVVAAKGFADQVGSVAQALKALETLQQLQ